MYTTHANKLAGRYSALDSNAKATAALNAAQEAIKALSDKEDFRSEAEKDMANLSPKLRKMFTESILKTDNEVDLMRLNTAAAVIGIRGAVIKMFAGKKAENFLSMSKDDCKRELAEALAIFNSVKEAFPTTEK